jgi:hypothetical protein
MTQLKEARAATVDNSTAQYRIFVLCNKCAGVHESGISVTIEDGPVDKKSVGDFYAAKTLPRTLANLSNESFSCPLTGRQFIQKDLKQIFLVPLNDRRYRK